jgi:hypothetical protein
LEAIAVGYSLRFPDDQENLRRQFEVYDALHAWCRLEVPSRKAMRYRASIQALAAALFGIATPFSKTLLTEPQPSAARLVAPCRSLS